ncbi:MAG: hypothetical protein HKN11_00100 [Rhizobiales bacterium]|nr:hypothetical protein [Hyphomicrobiales bacterium]
MITQWLERITSNEAPAGDIIAFNVGLLQTADGHTAYLTGSRIYDADDDDWACNEDFSPAERYCPLDPAPGDAPDWRTVQNDVAAQVKSFLASPQGRASYLGRARAVTVGFDDGELECVSGPDT